MEHGTAMYVLTAVSNLYKLSPDRVRQTLHHGTLVAGNITVGVGSHTAITSPNPKVLVIIWAPDCKVRQALSNDKLFVNLTLQLEVTELFSVFCFMK